MMGDGDDAQCSVDELASLKTLLQGIMSALDAVPLSNTGGGPSRGNQRGGGLTKPGEWAQEFFAGAAKAAAPSQQRQQLSFATKDKWLELIERVVSSLSAAVDPSQNQDTLAISKVSETIGMVYSANSLQESLRQCQYYKVHIYADDQMKPARRNFNEFSSVRNARQMGGRVFGYWCFNPGLAMQALHEYGTTPWDPV